MATVGSGRRFARSALSRQRVLQAAVALADESGSEALSMRRLGEVMGVEAMSLYHHVASKDDLLDGMIDAVFGEIEPPSAGDGWNAMLRSRANSTRQVLCRHGWAIRFMDSRTAPGPATLRHHDAALGCLRAAGFPLQLAGQALSVLDSYVYGFALRERTLGFGTPEQSTPRSERLTVPIPSDVYPHLAESMVEKLNGPECGYRNEFDVGLDLILAGIHPTGDRAVRQVDSSEPV